MRKPALALSVGCAVFALLVVLAARPAQAAHDEHASSVEEARAHFYQGVQLFSESSFETALAEFDKAYRISPNYRILYNIAQTYFELHDYVNAEKSLKQYVQDGEGEIPAARRAQVNELNQKLAARIAYLEVVVSEDDAEIRVDDVPVGTSPLKSPVPVNAGPRRVVAVKPGRDIAVRLVTVAGGDKVKVALEIPAPAVAPAGVSTPAAAPSARGPIDTVDTTIFSDSPSPQKSSRVGLYTSLAVAGGCAVATGIFGFLAIQAKKDFDKQLDTIPNTQANIENARSKAQGYVYAADAFGAATLISAGVALYLGLSGDHESTSEEKRAEKPSAALAPTLGGVVLHGTW